MHNRLEKIKNIYKKAAYKGFPFLHWFENETRYRYENDRLYIPYSESTISIKDISDELKKEYPLIIDVANYMYEDVQDINMVTGEVVYSKKFEDQTYYKKRNLDGNLFLSFIKKISYKSQELSLFPEENFIPSKKAFFDSLFSNNEFFTKQYFAKIYNNVEQFYKNKEGQMSFEKEDLINVLIKLTSDYQEQMHDFLQDTRRLDKAEDKSSELMVVISHDRNDVLHMSTGRRWSSCMNISSDAEDGSRKPDAYCEVEDGGFIAYLIKKDDLNVENPISRVLIRRFDTLTGDSIALIEEKLYGENNQRFLDIVKNWVKEKQPEISPGIYRLKGGTFSDTYGKKSEPVAIGDLEDYFKKAVDVDFEEGYYVSDELAYLLPRESDRYISSKLDVIKETPFVKTKEEAKSIIEKARKTIPSTYELSGIMHQVMLLRLNKKYPKAQIHSSVGSTSLTPNYDAFVSYFEDNMYKKQEQKIKEYEEEITLTEKGISNFEKDIEKIKKKVKQETDPDKIEDLEEEIEDLNYSIESSYEYIREYQNKIYKEEQKNNQIASELRFTKNENEIKNTILSEDRFEIWSTTKEQYLRNIYQLNSTMITPEIKNQIKNISQKTNNLSLTFWNRYMKDLSTEEQSTLILNNPQTFKKEFFKELDELKSFIDLSIRKIPKKETYSAEKIRSNNNPKSLLTFIRGIKESFLSETSSDSFGNAILFEDINKTNQSYKGAYIANAINSEDQEAKEAGEEIKKIASLYINDFVEAFKYAIQNATELLNEINFSNEDIPTEIKFISPNIFDIFLRITENKSGQNPILKELKDKLFSIYKEIHAIEKLSNEKINNFISNTTNEMEQRGFYSETSPDNLMQDKLAYSKLKSKKEDIVYSLEEKIPEDIYNMELLDFMSKRLYKNIDYYPKTISFLNKYGEFYEDDEEDIKNIPNGNEIVEDVETIYTLWNKVQNISGYIIKERYDKFKKILLNEFDQAPHTDLANNIQFYSKVNFPLTQGSVIPRKTLFPSRTKYLASSKIQAININTLINIIIKNNNLKEQYQDYLLEIQQDIKKANQELFEAYNIIIRKEKELRKNKNNIKQKRFNLQYKSYKLSMRKMKKAIQENLELYTNINRVTNLKTARKYNLYNIIKMNFHKLFI